MRKLFRVASCGKLFSLNHNTHAAYDEPPNEAIYTYGESNINEFVRRDN